MSIGKPKNPPPKIPKYIIDDLELIIGFEG